MICWPQDLGNKIYYPRVAKKLRKEAAERKKELDRW